MEIENERNARSQPGLAKVPVRVNAAAVLAAMVGLASCAGRATSDTPGPGAMMGSGGAPAGPTPSGGSGGSSGSVGSGGSSGSGGSEAAPDAATDADHQGPTTDANCGLKTFALDRLPPDLLIVLDRSGSMVNQATGGSCGVTRTCGTRWVEITTAINQVVARTQTTIRWGLKFFADVPACDINDGATVPIGAGSAPAIATAIMNTMTGGQTPTRAAMISAGAYLKALADPNPKFVLLATDGEPNCQEGNPMLAEPDTAAAVASVKAVADLGFPVFVVGVATSGNALDLTLRQMAQAGGRPRVEDPPYFPVSSSDDLVTALGKIGGQITSCGFTLGSAPPDPTNVAVKADGLRVPQDPMHAQGWDYGAGMTSIQLYGSWCDQAKDGKVRDVQAIFGCPGVLIP